MKFPLKNATDQRDAGHEGTVQGLSSHRRIVDRCHKRDTFAFHRADADYRCALG